MPISFHCTSRATDPDFSAEDSFSSAMPDYAFLSHSDPDYTLSEEYESSHTSPLLHTPLEVWLTWLPA